MHDLSLLSLFSKPNLGLTFSLLLLIGCAQTPPIPDVDAVPNSAPQVQSDFDELLDFSANMANMPDSARTEACRSLLKSKKNSSEAKGLLHLMVGRLFSDACGDIPKILNRVDSIPPQSNLPDDRMQKLIAIHTEALKRLQNSSKKTTMQERKQKKSQSALEPKEVTESKKNETLLLREKLEAIRSMEKHLDQTGDTH